jgi:hypothetical protein
MRIREKLTDKERILTVLAQQLAFATFRVGVDHFSAREEDWGLSRIHFARYRKAVAGDLAIASSFNMHANKWTIGWVVQADLARTGEWIIREIGSDRLCNYGNETFIPIAGIRGHGYDDVFLEGAERKFAVAARRANAPHDNLVRYVRTTFDGEMATVCLREKWTSNLRHVVMKWKSFRSIGAIERALHAEFDTGEEWTKNQ